MAQAALRIAKTTRAHAAHLKRAMLKIQFGSKHESIRQTTTEDRQREISQKKFGTQAEL
jgi:hypothetical protein